MINFVYKILTLKEWMIFQKEKTILSNFDKSSGFIHLSTKKQIKETIKNYFVNHRKLVIISFKVSEFKNKLKWEMSTNGDLYPHLYTTLNFKNIYHYRFLNCHDL